MNTEQPKKQPSIWVILAVLIVVCWGFAVLKYGHRGKAAPRLSSVETPAPDPAEQLFTPAQAEDLVAKMKQTGVVTDVDVDPIYTYVDVGHPWDDLTYKQKQMCALALHRYSVLHGGSQNVAMRDAYTNRKVAVYVSGVFSLR